MEFDCELKTTKRKETWKGEINSFINYGSYYEAIIESRSSILVLFGKTSRGGFACMPDYKVGCHLADFKNRFWNEEKLCSALGKIDGITVATALYQLAMQNVL